MDFVPATLKRTPYNFRRSLIPAPKMYNVHYIAKYLQVGWSGRKVEASASTPRNIKGAAAWLLSSSAPHFAGKEKILIRYAWNIWLLPCRGQPGDKSKNYYGGCLLPPHLHEQARWWAPGSSTQLGGLTQQTSVEIKKPVRERWDHVCVCANNLSCVTSIQANVSSQWLELELEHSLAPHPRPLLAPDPGP